MIEILWGIFKALLLIVGIISTLLLAYTLIAGPIEAKKRQKEMDDKRNELFGKLEEEVIKAICELKEEEMKKKTKKTTKRNTKKSKEN